ncbi:unnamed protein product, partial [Hapterophycus canaliculatus]
LDPQVFWPPGRGPHLRYALAGGTLDEATLLEALRPPVSRAVFDSAVGDVIEARRTRTTGGGGIGGGEQDAGQQQQHNSPVIEDATAASLHPAQDSSLRPIATDNGGAGGGGGGGGDRDQAQRSGQQQPQRRRSSGTENGGGGGSGVAASPEERQALLLLKGYIETAAQHAANKGRGISGGGGGGSGGGLRGGSSGSSGGSVAGGRKLSPVYLPDSLSQAIYVPTQKITTLHPGVGAAAVAVAKLIAPVARAVVAEGGSSGEGRRQRRLQQDREGLEADEDCGEDDADLRLCSPALSANPALLQSVTGMHTNAVDARRAMALVEQPDGDGAGGPDNASNSNSYSYRYASSPALAPPQQHKQGKGGSAAPAWEASRGSRQDGAAVALVRKAKALGVPPLPPDLGAVRAPNGAKYSHYLLDSGSGGGGGGGGGGAGGTSSSSSSSGAGGGGSSRSAYPPTTAAAAAAAAQQQQQQRQQQQSHYEHGAGGSGGGGGSVISRRPDWRPRQGVLVASLREHGGAVNRLALSQDQAFFVSASSDSTCKVWELRGMDHTVSAQSRATYSRQGGRLLDLCMVDNSHSVASASSDGTVHVWRVELAASASGTPYGSFTMSTSGSSSTPNSAGSAAAGGGLSPTKGGAATAAAVAAARQQALGLGPSQGGGNAGGRRYSGGGGGSGGGPVDSTLSAISSAAGGGGVGRLGRGGGGLRVCGSSMVRCVSPKEGAVVSVHHFNTELGSPLVYGTRKGGVRSWDLRAREEPWALRAHPELGFLTVIALGTEKTWLVVGTSRGFVMLWDLRFQARRICAAPAAFAPLQILARLWRHSSGGPVHKLATCSRLPPPDAAPGPHVIVAAGRNEAAIWDLSKGGACKQCFRVVAPSEGPAPPLTSGRGSRGSHDRIAIPGAELPVLEEVSLPSHPNAPALSLGAQLSAVRDFSSGAPQTGGDPAIRALVGR